MTGIGGPSRKSGGLTKNSVIKCTIDDVPLEDGVLVVSFSHKDNLYQGVLLQLNRERGIPAGISFPKDYFSETKKEVDQNPPNVPQTPPLNQRNTYFQETDNGRQYRSLRRIIKTPARFKNSRMSLRPVQRPVLCAKCGALCNDKDASKDTGSNACITSTTTIDNEKPKKNGDSKKLPPKTATKDKPQLALKVTPLKLSPIECKTPPLPIDDSHDLNYQVVRSLGIVDNYWKRPNAKPVRETRQNNTKSGEEKVKTLKIISKLSAASSSTKFPMKTPEPSQINSGSLFRVKKAPQPLSTDNHKANNLKLCITKLHIAQEAKFTCNSDDSSGSNSQQTDEPQLVELIPKKITSPQQPVASASKDAALSVPPVKVKIPIFRTKLKLKRRNSTMPNRFRDKSHSSAWRTRRVSTMSNPDDNNKVISADDDCEPPSTNGKCRLKSELKAEFPLSSLYKDDNSQQFISDLSPIESPETFQDSDVHSDSGEPTSTTSTTKIEPVKTPVIKITFGSSGNGTVLEIAPRNTNHNHNDTEGGIKDSTEADSKAARKALKRAKKEAKRKLATKSSASPPMPVLSIAGEAPVPPVSLTKPALTPLTIHLNSRRNADSGGNELPGAGDSVSSEPLLIENAELERSSKKKKKAKKKKKSKVHKENDLSSQSSGESHSFLVTVTAPVTQLSSPVLKSDIANLNPTPKSESSVRKRKRSTSPLHDECLDKKGPLENLVDSPSTGTPTSETPNHHRVCLSLKRVKDQSNAYIPSWNSSFSSDEHGTTSDSAENEESQDFQETSFEFLDEPKLPMESIVTYNHKFTHGHSHEFKKGEIVWGKSTGCLWWPGKIVEILLRGATDARAKIAWYKSETQSYIAFPEVRPFQEYFHMKYSKEQRKGCYQKAVEEALMEVTYKTKH